MQQIQNINNKHLHPPKHVLNEVGLVHTICPSGSPLHELTGRGDGVDKEVEVEGGMLVTEIAVLIELLSVELIWEATVVPSTVDVEKLLPDKELEMDNTLEDTEAVDVTTTVELLTDTGQTSGRSHLLSAAQHTVEGGHD